jgi:adenine-specific DNA-methyltransferase
MFYPVYFNEKTKEISLNKKRGLIEILPITKGELGRWRWFKTTFLKNLEMGNLVAEKNREGRYDIFEKMRPEINEIMRTTTPKSVWYKPEYDTGSAGRYLKNILLKEAFDNPKSLFYIFDILKISTDKDAIILDFFAGSGTTGHAVLELNKEDGGNRQFILCTNNENNICTDVCYPRIKKVIEGYKNLKGKKVDGLGGNLKYYKTSFVPKSRVSDDTKYNLVQRSTEMICMKEDTFEKVVDKKYIKIFKNINQYTAILFHLDYFNEFKKELRGLDKQIHIYVFSLTSDTYDEDFKDLKQKYDLCPIPESILEVFKRFGS